LFVLPAGLRLERMFFKKEENVEKKSNRAFVFAVFAALVVILGFVIGYLISHERQAGSVAGRTIGERALLSSAENIARARENLPALIAAVKSDENSATAKVELGRAYLILGEKKMASNEFKAAVAIDPGNGEALLGLGDAYEQMGNYEDAMDAYKRLIGIEPDNLEAFYSLGNVYQKAEKLEEGLSEIGRIKDERRAALDDTPEETSQSEVPHQGQYLDASIAFYAGLGMHEVALKEIGENAPDPELPKIRERVPEPASVLAGDLEKRSRAGDLPGMADGDERDGRPASTSSSESDRDTLKEIFKKIKDEKSASVATHTYTGFMHEKDGNYQAAINDYLEALKLDSGFFEALEGLARCYVATGQNDEALDVYGKVISMDPYNYEAYVSIAGIHQQKGRREQAAVAFKKALDINPSDGKIWFMRGVVNVEIAEYEEAISSFKSSLEKGGVEKGNYVILLEAILSALKSRASESSAGQNLAFNFIMLGNLFDSIEKYDRAAESYGAACELEENNAVAFFSLAVAHYRNNDPEAALKAYEKLKHIDSNMAIVLKSFLGISDPPAEENIPPSDDGNGNADDNFESEYL